VIRYQIPVDSRVSVKVYNVLGNVVTTLQNGFQTAGEYSVTLDGSNLASGVYFYKIEAGEFTATKKMLLTK
jgi:flagellar hook assembly protein FlgD